LLVISLSSLALLFVKVAVGFLLLWGIYQVAAPFFTVSYRSWARVQYQELKSDLKAIERDEQMAELDHQLEMQEKTTLAEQRLARANGWEWFWFVIAISSLIAVVLFLWKLALGRSRTVHTLVGAGGQAAIAYASQSRIEKLTYSPKISNTGMMSDGQALPMLPDGGASIEAIIEQSLAGFGLPVRVVGKQDAPQVEIVKIRPGRTEKKRISVRDIMSRADDLALDIGKKIRIAPLGNVFGVEVAKDKPDMVLLSEILASPDWRNNKMALPIPLGKDIHGNWQIVDLQDFPHLLLAGQTGSGKSVALNAILLALMSRYSPQELNLLLMDPKMVELIRDRHAHHCEVVTEMDKAANALGGVG